MKRIGPVVGQFIDMSIQNLIAREGADNLRNSIVEFKKVLD